MFEVKQSTALALTFFAHDADGDAVTSLVDGGFTKRISKNGGAFGAMTVTITEMENGWYSFTLSAGHSDTLGVISITFINGSCKQVNMQFRVAARIADDLATSANLTVAQNDLDDLTGADGAILASSQPNYAPNVVVPDAAGVAPTAEEVVDEWETQANADPTGFKVNVIEVGDTPQTANDNGADINTILSRIIGTLASGTHEPQGGDAYAIVNHGTYGNSALQVLIAALENLSAAGAEAAADAALVSIHLDHLLAVVYDPASKPGVADALLNELIGNDAGISQLTANALELAPGGGDATEAKQDSIIAAVITNAANADIAADIIELKTETAAILEDTTGLNGDAMVGTNGANTTTPPTVGEIQAEMEADGTSLLDTIRDAIIHGTYGLSALQTLIADIPDTSEFEARTLLAASYFAPGVDTVLVGTNNDKTDYLLSAAGNEAIWALDGGDDSYTFKEMMQIILSSVAGKVSISGTTVTFRNLADDRNVITIIVNAVTEERTSASHNPEG